MKAIVQSVYGSADVLEFIDIDVPAVGDDEVLIRVQAAGLHIGDWHVMTGLPLYAPSRGLRAVCAECLRSGHGCLRHRRVSWQERDGVSIGRRCIRNVSGSIR